MHVPDIHAGHISQVSSGCTDINMRLPAGDMDTLLRMLLLLVL